LRYNDFISAMSIQLFNQTYKGNCACM